MSTTSKPAAKNGKGQTNRPFKTIRRGGLKAVIWENQTKNGAMFSVQLVRVYRDDNGDWQQTYSFNSGDLLDGAKLLDLADSAIMRELERREQEQPRQREPGEDPVEE
jgi:hypothetical protein